MNPSHRIIVSILVGLLSSIMVMAIGIIFTIIISGANTLPLNFPGSPILARALLTLIIVTHWDWPSLLAWGRDAGTVIIWAVDNGVVYPRIIIGWGLATIIAIITFMFTVLWVNRILEKDWSKSNNRVSSQKSKRKDNEKPIPMYIPDPRVADPVGKPYQYPSEKPPAKRRIQHRVDDEKWEWACRLNKRIDLALRHQYKHGSVPSSRQGSDD